MSSSASTELRVGSQRPTKFLLPADQITSAAEEAEELGRRCGLYLDEWQSWCLHYMLGERAGGAWAASLICLILPRQNGKNAVLEVIELAALYLFGEKKIIHSAHRADTAKEHMERMKVLVQSNPELERITKFYDANGKERMVRTDTKAVIHFVTRGGRVMRGPSPQRIIFDEALNLEDHEIQAMVPSMSAQSMNEEGAPQQVYTSSAPLRTSTVLHRVRERALGRNHRRMFFAEWGCELGADPEDRENWYLANPGLGIRISEEWIEDNELGLLGDEGFAIERMGVVFPVVVDDREPKLPQDDWEISADTEEDDSPEGPVQAITFDVDADGASATIGLSIGTIVDPYVEQVDFQAGVGWLPARMVELIQRWKPREVACNGHGPAGAQVGPIQMAFREAGLTTEVRMLGSQDYQQACGGFYTDVVEGRLSRLIGQGELDAAGEDATARPLGEAWVWDRNSASAEVPISPLVAVTIARHLLPEPAKKVQEPMFATT